MFLIISITDSPPWAGGAEFRSPPAAMELGLPTIGSGLPCAVFQSGPLREQARRLPVREDCTVVSTWLASDGAGAAVRGVKAVLGANTADRIANRHADYCAGSQLTCTYMPDHGTLQRSA